LPYIISPQVKFFVPLFVPPDQPMLPLNQTDALIRTANIGEWTYGQGLILVVRPGRDGKLRRGWFLRIMTNGRRRKLGLGSYPLVKLAEARNKAQDARRALAAGLDPSVRAKRLAADNERGKQLSLGQAIDSWLAQAAPKYKNVKSEAIRDRILDRHFAPLRERDVTTIKAADIAAILRMLAPQTAVKACSTIRAVFDFAAGALDRFDVTLVNPADPRRLKVLGWTPKSPKAVAPHPALDWRQIPAFMASLERQEGIEARCLAFIVLTTARAGAARLAKWRDIDLEKRRWAVPAQDLKDSRHRTAPFIAPLSEPAIELIKALPRRGPYVFPGAAGRPINDRPSFA
jgi:integrase